MNAAADWFQPSYRVSRARLLERAHQTALRHDLLIDSRALAVRGPQGETLALDFMIFGARRPRQALLLSSGTHGVEGYCGAALQHWLVQALLPRVRLPEGTAVIVQHANNPYGFAWNRRVNENNVDINRNFRESFDPGFCVADYEALADYLNPPDLDPDQEAQRQRLLDAFIAEHGIRSFQTALSEGQCKHPKGMQFAGRELQEGPAHLLDLTREHLADCRRLIWLDVHTGLGPSGGCELITGALPGTPIYQRTRQIWGEKVKSANSGESISPPLTGLLDGGINRVLPAQCEVAFGFPEFGTHDMTRVMRAMRADNWLNAWGDRDSPAGRAITAELLEAFRPDSREWERQVLATGIAQIEQALAALPGVVLPWAPTRTTDAPGPGTAAGSSAA